MKKMNIVRNTITEGTLTYRERSRIGSINHRIWSVIAPMLLVVFGLFGVNERAWGGTWYAKIDAAADPSNGGYVYVGTNEDCSASNATKSKDDGENSASKKWQSNGDVNLWLCAKAKSGYTFKGWNTDQSNTVLSGSTAVPYKATVHGTAKVLGIGGESYDYYAIFARLTASSTDEMEFGTKLIGVGWSEGTTKSVTIDYVHAGKITATITGTNATEFSLSSSSSSQSTEVVSNNTNSETNSTITVYFNPSSVGSKSAKLTISSNNNLTSIEINLSGTGQATVDPTFTNTIDTSYYVEAGPLNLASLWTSDNENGTITYSKVSFTADVENEAGATVPSISNDNKLSLGQAGTLVIQMHQAASTGYYEKTVKDTIRIKKRQNTLYANSSASFAPTMYTDKSLAVTLTATNTDYAGSPISVEQVNTADTTIAKYEYSQASHSGTVTSRQFLASTSWHMTQPENYKYLAGENTFSVTVANASEATNCYIVTNESDQIEKTVGNWLEDTPGKTINLDSRGSSLTFQARKSRNDAISQLFAQATKNGNDWYDLNSEALDLGTSNNTYGPYDVKDVKSIRFCVKSGGSYTKYIDHICVTRKTYLNVGTDNSSINGTLTINKKDGVSAIYPGEKGQQSTTVYWGIANGGNLKIKCDDPRFTFSQNTITGVDCNSGTTDIYAYYSDTIAGTVTATATVYNDVYNRTFTVKGVIEKADQLITWHNDILRLGQSYTDVATANTLVTYESSDVSIIRVDEDDEGHKTILTAVGTGTVNIKATAEETSYYAEKSDTKSIKVTDKQIQWIDWNQSLFGLKLGGANVTMNAVAASDVEGCGSSRLIEYSSSNESVVKVVNNNQLQIIDVGTAIITAVQAGGFDTDGHDYERAETEKTVIVRNPNAPCESFAYQQGQEVKMDCGWNALNKQTRTSEINFNGIIPATGTLRYKGEYRKVAINYFDGTMTVEQYIPGENWQPVTGGDLGKPSIGTYKTANLTFDRRATKMRVKVTDGLGYHYFTDCQVTQARFIETTAPVDFNLNVGQQQNQVIYLSYSNITDGLLLTLAQGANSHFSVDKSFIEGSCGSAAKNVALTITYHPTTEETNAQDVLTITDGTTSCQVVLTGSATRVNRHIIWDHADETNIYTVQIETLSAEARTDLNELAGVVTFSLASSSTATGAISMENVLSFTSAGVANVVAYTTDDARYNAAPNVTKVFNVSKTPTTISTLPVLEAVTSGTAVGDVELTGWQVTNTVNGGVVEGTLAITSADLINVGTNTVTLTFTPSNTDMYVGCTGTTTIVVNKATSVATPSAANIVYGQKVNESVLSNEGTAGTWSWTDEKAEDILAAGTYNDLAVHFTPTSGNYTELDATVSLTVEKAAASLTWTTAPTELAYNATGVIYEASSTSSEGAITYSIKEGDEYASIDAETGELTIIEAGHTITVQASQAESDNYNAPTSITVEVTIGAAPLSNVFTNEAGDGDWENPENWESGIVPTSDPDIIVTGALEINDSITVGSLTIEQTGSVAVISGGTLTVNGTSEDRTEYGDVHVMSDGALALGNSADLQVRDFTLDASLGNSSNTATSGQVSGDVNLHINRDAYFQMSFDPSGAISFGWYDFTVPFKVNIAGGIERINSIDDKVMVSGVDFMIMEADEQNRANGGKGWRNVNSGALQPGKLYTITFNYQAALPQNTFRFTWNGEGEIANGDTYAAKYATGGDGSLNGWNGLGNGMLRHGYLAAGYKLQAYCHETNTYDLVNEAKTFAVGSAFFIQVAADGDVQWKMANATEDRPLYAPKRAVQETEEFRLSLFAEESDIVSDYLFCSANEDATEAYIIGHDLLKMGTPTDSKVARMWAKKGGKNLCDMEAALVNNKANCALGLYAPKAGSYWLAIDEAPEDASLYLTYNDAVIWDLTISPYLLDLSKGTTTGYGLRMEVKKTPAVTTDVEQAEISGQSSVRKVIIDNKVYIVTPEGKMYDIIGKGVKF